MKLSVRIGDWDSALVPGLLVTSRVLDTAEVRDSYIEVPGRDGDIDNTEALGRRAYKDRELKIYAHLYGTLERRMAVREGLMSAVNGKELDCVINIESQYTVHGRWTVEYDERANITEFVITGRCNPFRFMQTLTFRVNAAAGYELNLPCGDKSVSPTFESAVPFYVECNGASAQLNAGSYTVTGLQLNQGNNTAYISTTPGVGDAVWTPLIDNTWDDLATFRWEELMWNSPPRTDSKYQVFVQYDWSDF